MGSQTQCQWDDVAPVPKSLDTPAVKLPTKKNGQKQQPRRTTEKRPAYSKQRPRSGAVNWNVLAERNYRIVPVGAWVECAQEEDEQEESLAVVTAAQVEQAYKEKQNEKERALKHFQEEVKRRVNQHLKLRKKQQFQQSCEAALKESTVVTKFSDSALQQTPKKSTCLYRYRKDSTIRSSGNKVISGQQPSKVPEWKEVQEPPLLEQAKTVRKTVQHVRRRLASRKTVANKKVASDKKTAQELPGGLSKISPKQKSLGMEGQLVALEKRPASPRTTPALERTLASPVTTSALEETPASPMPIPANIEAGDTEEFYLKGYHELPAELRKQTPQIQELYCSNELEKASSITALDSCPAGSSAVVTEPEAPLVLYPGKENEESKKQRQNQYLRYRRLFMDIEREQVKEQQRKKKWQKKMDKIKREKERYRLAEEMRLQEMASYGTSSSGSKTCEILEQLRLEDMRETRKVMEREQRFKDYSRYVEALRAQMREKIKMYKIDLPPLCFCGVDFWDCHPDSCANNCVFYRNHKAYAEALQSVISSCDAVLGCSNIRLSVHTFAAVHARSGKHF